ncbi:hypothetical protein ACFFP0_24695 [Rhizobium puerariae]|uniref:Uncharacterized protein n=1 Tax=Rhizobium puerariae TaxID=1585791 RepID=A0ABV6ARX8_9HYPH
MANHAIVQSSGTEIHPGQWIVITFRDGAEYVGRFSGVWNNPSYGLMFSLAFARPADGSKKPDTVFCRLEPDNGIAAALDAAKIIDKPAKRKPRGAPPGIVLH